MKVIFLNTDEYEVNKFAIQNAIRNVRNKYRDLVGFPELDEHFESEFRCNILYCRERGILGFKWDNDADFSWFVLRNAS